MNAIFKNAWPYQDDKMSLPVKDLESAVPFYEAMMGFKVVSRKQTPVKSAVLRREDIEIGLAENGGDPSQDGCFIEVDSIEAALAELKSRGLQKEVSKNTSVEKHGDSEWKVIFIVAPDGLCYCLGERIT